MKTSGFAGEYDVIVVGARAAGAATAMLTARSGLRVLAVDRARRGSDTLSTHALMRTGVLQLHRWGLLDRIIDAGTPSVRRTVVHYGEKAVPVDLKPGAGIDALYAPRRTVLDPMLVEAAQEAGADFLFRVGVTDLLRDTTGRVAGIVGRDESGRRFEARSRLVVGADGINSLVARKTRARRYRTGQGSGALVYGYWSDVGIDGYEWFFRPGLSAGVIPTNNGQLCVFVGAPTHRFKSDLMGGRDRAVEQVFSKLDPAVGEELGRGRRGPLRGWPGVPGFFREAWGPGWALVGDAGYFKDPISAHGISDALRDAELLARAAVGAYIDGEPEDEALSAYQATRDRLSDRFFAATDRVATYQWNLTELFNLLLQTSAAMREEFYAMAALDEPLTTVAA
jgi:flavin-dependent dehydrogenase